MSFKVINCEQGSPEWHQARAGVCTASMFKVARQKVGGLDERQTKYVNAILSGQSETAARAIAGYKNAPTSETVQRALAGEKVGDWSDGSKNYAFRLAMERISGVPLDEGFETWQMARGHELEPEARREHQVLAGVIVDRAGFVTTEDGIFGASADGLIAPDGGSEYKCFTSPVSLRTVLLGNDYTDVMDQVQGCMWITGRNWWHLGFYCPQLAAAGFKMHLVQVKRDDEHIQALQDDLLAFNVEVDRMERDLRAMGTAVNVSEFAEVA